MAWMVEEQLEEILGWLVAWRLGAWVCGREVAGSSHRFNWLGDLSLCPWAGRLTLFAPVGRSGWECLLDD